ncbi:probable glycosyltransferase At5g25310 [Olea europaea subsp. europaea]|uniref:Probable glycosyltransferase At5g25310 n=1 Tax=Olea europaea subsp. europaea TaxID=158383 RepID=A0A8S0S894_OLEEU|nr:probable glycosyltransferase At5g25310 [Olea europaea subsp. europaea]
MIKLLHHIIVFLMYRINWRKLFFIGSVLTISSVFIQISTLPYPLKEWIFPPSTVVSSFEPLNTTTMGDGFETVHNATVIVSFNSSSKVNELVLETEEAEKDFRRRMQRTNKNSTSKVSPPFSPSPVQKMANNPLRYLSSSTPDEALAFAKRETENAPLVSDDPELYAPLFRNVSTFKRSYELMEQILKVYIYKEGKRPIFHHPYLRGIYSSEGWFMKLMEENRKFVTKDPEMAHLFYLPYSARQLQKALYVPDSHDLKPLSIILKDYVNMLAAKYPFWNRTHGSNHFLVACHDWGPYNLKEHKELQRNTIKALCNADVSEGVFIAGKDVSLPETTIRNPRRPLRNLGGKRASQRPILAFYAGHVHGRVRPVLLKYWKDKDEDMRIHGPLSNRITRVMSYPEHMKSSKYCICPMGYEVNSPRIVEAIYYECIPVIIADNFVPPFSEVLNWSSFSVIVAEKDIPKLKAILLSIPLKKYRSMQTNVKMLQKHFHWNAIPVRYDLFHMILHSIWSSRLNQIQGPGSS